MGARMAAKMKGREGWQIQGEWRRAEDDCPERGSHQLTTERGQDLAGHEIGRGRKSRDSFEFLPSSHRPAGRPLASALVGSVFGGFWCILLYEKKNEDNSFPGMVPTFS